MASHMPPPDYLADETRGPGLIAADVIMVVVGTVFVGLRFYTRTYIVNKLGLSDWIILIALIFDIGNSAGSIRQVVIGSTGRHFWTMAPATIGAWAETTYFTDLSYIVSLISIKTSILLLYLQILSVVFLRRLVLAAFVLVTIFSAYSLVTFIFMCNPPAAFWDPMNHPDAWCFPGALKYYIDVSVHLVGEIVILLLPMPFLLSLQMPFRKKMGYVMLFALGILLIIISIARLPSIVTFNTMEDPSWDAAPIAIWSTVELNVAIVCACGMTLRPLISRLFPGAFSDGFQRHRDNPGDDVELGRHPPTIGKTRQNKVSDGLDTVLGSAMPVISRDDTDEKYLSSKSSH